MTTQVPVMKMLNQPPQALVMLCQHPRALVMPSQHPRALVVPSQLPQAPLVVGVACMGVWLGVYVGCTGVAMLKTCSGWKLT